MTDITVTLDITANPAVTCTPKKLSVNRGNQEIKWKPGGNEGFTFPSNALTGLPDPPFSPPVINSEITVQDNNMSPGTYGYTVEVVSDANGNTYSTSSSTLGDPVPCIKNN